MNIKHVILAVVNHEPAYGYQIMGLLAGLFGSNWSVNSGQVYSTLSRLERDDEITRAASETPESRRRTRYLITDKGREQLRDWYLEPLSIDNWSRDDIPAKLALSQLSGPVPIEDIIQNQRRKLLKELHQFTLERDSNKLDERPGHHFYLQSAIMHLEADLRWLDIVEEHLEELRSAPLPKYEPRSPGRPRINGHEEE